MSKNHFPEDIDSFLDKFSESQLKQLHHKIIDRLNLQRKLQTLKAMSEFNPGDHISFDHSDTTYFGEVIKLNKKTVSIETEDGEFWNISPHVLTNHSN